MTSRFLTGYTSTNVVHHRRLLHLVVFHLPLLHLVVATHRLHPVLLLFHLQRMPMNSYTNPTITNSGRKQVGVDRSTCGKSRRGPGTWPN